MFFPLVDNRTALASMRNITCVERGRRVLGCWFDGGGPFPDLVIVENGKGQTALKVHDQN